MPAELPFWKTKSLAQMSDAEWESLCDGCGRCCLHKLRDEDTDRILHTEVSCRLLDTESCLCSDYPRRRRKVPDCVRLSPAALAGIDWLPPTCGYRRIADGLDLEWWHPLVSGSPHSVHQAGVSVRGRAISERIAGPLEEHVVDWPGEVPEALRSAPVVPAAAVPAPVVPGPVPAAIVSAPVVPTLVEPAPVTPTPVMPAPVMSVPLMSVPVAPLTPAPSAPADNAPSVPTSNTPARAAPVRPAIRRVPAAGGRIPR